MTTRTLLLPNVEFRPATRARDIALVVSASLLLALAAQIRIHLGFTPVPITGQTLVVGLTGLLLGSKRGAAAVALYLAEGALGLPFFAGGAAGAAVLIGSTGGYLLAMPLGAALAGLLAERGWDTSPVRTFLAMQACSLTIMVSGTVVLGLLLHDAGKAITLGFLPFIPGDIVKAALASFLLPSLWFLRRRG